MDFRERVKGALLGLGVGDAMGGPLAFMSREQILIKHGSVTEMIGGGWQGLRPGQSTDELELALLLGESLIEKGAYDRADVASRYVGYLDSRPTGLDNITRAALGAIASGTSADEASRVAAQLTGEDGSTGGTLVRTVPIGILRARDEGGMVGDTLSDAGLTHAAVESLSGSVIANLFLAKLLAGVGGFNALFDDVEGRLREGIEGVRPILSPVRQLEEPELRPAGGVSDTLETALFTLYWGDSFEDAVLRGIRLGGPPATIGGLVGAFAGAFHGPGALPDRWLSMLENRGRLERLADSLSGPGGVAA